MHDNTGNEFEQKANHDHLKKKKATRLAWALGVVVLPVFFYFGFIHFRSIRALPVKVGSGSNCESIRGRIPFFKKEFELETSCYLEFARTIILSRGSAVTEEEMLGYVGIFASEHRINVSVLLRMMDLWSKAHPRTLVPNTSELDRVKGDFDVAEGLVSIMEFFEMEPLDLSETSHVEERREKKLKELMTASEWIHGMKTRMMALEATASKISASAELTLLDLRVKKMDERLKGIPARWKMPEALESLHIQDTDPDAYKTIVSVIHGE